MLARRFMAWFVDTTDVLLDFLGIGDVSLGMSSNERRTFIVMSVLPLFSLISLAYQLAYEIDNGEPGFVIVGGNGSVWARIYASAATSEGFVPLLALGFLVLHGVNRISRELGTWCFVVAVWLIALAALALVYSSAVTFLVDPADYWTWVDLHAGLARTAAVDGAIVAAGYGFLAFRGLAPQPGRAVAGRSGAQ